MKGAAGMAGPAEEMVAIILVNWNGWRDSIACIDSCLALDHPSFRIILCDNDSGDESVEAIAAWARGELDYLRDPDAPVAIAEPRRPRGVAILDRAAAEHGADAGGAELVIVRTGGNLGFAGGNNVGLRWALARNCAFAWLLNNDTVVPSDCLDCLVSLCRADPAIGLCGSTMVEYYRPDTLQGYAAAMHLGHYRSRHLGAQHRVHDLALAEVRDPAKSTEIIYPIGASILVTRAFLKKIGLMEEGYFLYYEEADWVLRAMPAFRVAIARDSIVYHKVGASAGSTPQGLSSRSVGFLYRSRLRIVRRFAPGRLPVVILGILEEAARGMLRGRWSRPIAAIRALTGWVKLPVQAEKAKSR